MPYRNKEDQAAYGRSYYERNRELTLVRSAAGRKKSRARNQVYVQQLKGSTPCADCGVIYPYYVMQFDHLGDDKEGDVATISSHGTSIKRLEEEISKCQIVCANCHAGRTFRRRFGINN